jgi:hypothetical protein
LKRNILSYNRITKAISKYIKESNAKAKKKTKTKKKATNNYYSIAKMI